MQKDVIENIYAEHYKELYLYILSLCKNHHVAEEIVSDTFVKALISLEVSNSNIKFWLFRVGKNLWLDYLKKNKRISDIPLDEATLISKEDILNKIILSEKRKLVYSAVLTLPDSYKEVIVLFYYCDFSLLKIAESMKISNGAARTLLYRSRNKLKVILKEDIE